MGCSNNWNVQPHRYRPTCGTATDDLISANQLQCMHRTCAQLALCGKPASGRLYSYFYQRVIIFSMQESPMFLFRRWYMHTWPVHQWKRVVVASISGKAESRWIEKREAKQTMVGGVSTHLKVTVESERRKARARGVLPLRHLRGKAVGERCQGQLCVTSSNTSTYVNDVNSWLPPVDLTSINNS